MSLFFLTDLVLGGLRLVEGFSVTRETLARRDGFLARFASGECIRDAIALRLFVRVVTIINYDYIKGLSTRSCSC